MRSWWGNKSSKEVKKKSSRESIIGSLHRQCIRPGPPRKKHSDTVPEKVFSQTNTPPQSAPPSKQVSRCQSFVETTPRAQPLPLPDSKLTRVDSVEPSIDGGAKKLRLLSLPKHVGMKIKTHAVNGERDDISSDSSSDTDDPYHSRLPSPQTSDYESKGKSARASPRGVRQKELHLVPNRKKSTDMFKPPTISLSNQTGQLTPHLYAQLHIPPRGIFSSAPDSSRSSPSRSPIGVFGSGPCSSPGSGHNSVTGDSSCHPFGPHSRCSPECSPLPSPKLTSPGPNSRIHSGTVTPVHPRVEQSHRLPLPPVKISNTYPAGTSRSPGKTMENPSSPVSRWKKGRLLGRGSFGHVYQGFSSESGEMCAMKEVTLFADDSKSRESAQQLGQEIALLSRLRHPNIVQYYGSETLDDKLYIYLEYVSGGSIYKILQDYGPLGEAAIRSYTQQILSGLAYLHAKNTVHRDIKGANILVDPSGRVKLADFGMAKHITGESCPLSFKGSPYWMAPELIQVIKNSSGCNLAVDIWSLGCTVLEMATTKPPWSQYEGVAAMFKIGNSKELPAIPDHLSDDGKDFVRQCLQRNPVHRPTAAQLLDHPFVKNIVSSERMSINNEHIQVIPTITHAVRTRGFVQPGTPPCLDSTGVTINRPKSRRTVTGYSDAYLSRNISCPVSPIGSPLSYSRSSKHVNGRLSPSPISSPRVISGCSTPLGGGNGALPLYHPKQPTDYLHQDPLRIISKSQNTFHPNDDYQEQKKKPSDKFRGIVQAHLSMGTLARDNKPGFRNQREPLYDAHLVLANRVSQKLLRNPVRSNPHVLDLNPNSQITRHNNRV